MYTHQKQIVTAGTPAKDAQAALIMIHGRGGTAQNILNLARNLQLTNVALYAPQATQQSWYPYSFMAPDKQNQPTLNSALETIEQVVEQVITDGIATERIYFLGFSQGACLTLEYITRNARQYGGAVAFTGGLIGEQLSASNYNGDFKSTPVLLTTGDPDMHVPLSRVKESVTILKEHGANVTLKVYPGRPHTITEEELNLANQLIFA